MNVKKNVLRPAQEKKTTVLEDIVQTETYETIVTSSFVIKIEDKMFCLK